MNANNHQIIFNDVAYVHFHPQNHKKKKIFLLNIVFNCFYPFSLWNEGDENGNEIKLLDVSVENFGTSFLLIIDQFIIFPSFTDISFQISITPISHEHLFR